MVSKQKVSMSGRVFSRDSPEVLPVFQCPGNAFLSWRHAKLDKSSISLPLQLGMLPRESSVSTPRAVAVARNTGRAFFSGWADYLRGMLWKAVEGRGIAALSKSQQTRIK